MQTSETIKKAAVDFLSMIVAGDIDEAYEKYIDMSGKHHNTFTPAGMPALRKGMKDAHVRFPNKQFTIQHVVADDELVAVHSHMNLEPGKTDMTVVHLFRFQNTRIVEMWDVGQVLSTERVNADGAF